MKRNWDFNPKNPNLEEKADNTSCVGINRY